MGPKPKPQKKQGRQTSDPRGSVTSRTGRGTGSGRENEDGSLMSIAHPGEEDEEAIKERSPSLEFTLSLLIPEVTPESDLPPAPRLPPKFVMELAPHTIPRYCGVLENNYLHGWARVDYGLGLYYEGTFVNGYMHGNGRLEWDDGIIYEGDLNYNQLDGCGFYRWDDHSTYKGVVLNGLKHGLGTFRTKDHKRGYSGDWSHGKIHGKGRILYDGPQDYFDGYLMNGMRQGWGERHYKTGNVFRGHWLEGIKCGRGTMIWKDKNGCVMQSYAGEWGHGKPNGYGKHTWYVPTLLPMAQTFRTSYTGQWLNGCRHGFGIMRYSSGAIYEGEWCNNLRQGSGTYTTPNGMVFTGLFRVDKLMCNQEKKVVPFHVSSHFCDWKVFLAHFLGEEDEPELVKESIWMGKMVLQYVDKLRDVYNRYAWLGSGKCTPPLDGVSTMTKMGCWLIAREAQLEKKRLTPSRLEVKYTKIVGGLNHNPFEELAFHQFLEYLCTAALLLYWDPCPPTVSQEASENEKKNENENEEERITRYIPKMAKALRTLLEEDVLPNCYSGRAPPKPPYTADAEVAAENARSWWWGDEKPWHREGLPPLLLMYELFCACGNSNGAPIAARDLIRRIVGKTIAEHEEEMRLMDTAHAEVTTTIDDAVQQVLAEKDKCPQVKPINLDGVLKYVRVDHLVQEMRKLYPNIIGGPDGTDLYMEFEINFLDFCDIIWECTKVDYEQEEIWRHKRLVQQERDALQQETLHGTTSATGSMASVRRKISSSRKKQAEKKPAKPGPKISKEGKPKMSEARAKTPKK